MADTAIEWTDFTWNPLVGCTRVSPGCQHCYAEIFAHRLELMGQPKYQGLTKKVGKEVRWTGAVRFVEEALWLPFQWKKPKRVFTNSMSDLFHDKVTDAQIAAIFAVMALTPRHTYQVLTKRPERMRDWVRRAGEDLDKNFIDIAMSIEGPWVEDADVILHNYVTGWSRFANMPADGNPLDGTIQRWPLPNVWLGTSVENQETAEERVPLLCDTPGVIRFLSVEPMLGPITFHRLPLPEWLIVGFESGPAARPGKLSWIVELLKQCRIAGVKTFVKQLGPSYYDDAGGRHYRVFLEDKKGGDPDEWPPDIRIRQMPEAL